MIEDVNSNPGTAYSLTYSYPHEKDWVEFERKLPPSYSRRRSDYTPLQVALICENQQACQTLLDQGANANELGKAGLSPLKMAFNSESEAFALLLAKQGANVDELCVLPEYAFPVPIWLSILTQGKNYNHFLAYCLEHKKIDPNASIGGITILAWAVLLIKPLQISQRVLGLFIDGGAHFFPCVMDTSFLKATFQEFSDELYKSQNVLQLLLIAYGSEWFDMDAKSQLFQFFYSRAKDADKLHKDCDERSLMHYALLKKWEWAANLLLDDSQFAVWMCGNLTRGGTTPLTIAKSNQVSEELLNRIKYVDAGYTQRVKKLRRFINISGFPEPDLEGETRLYPKRQDRFINPYFKWIMKTFFSYAQSDECLYRYVRQHIDALQLAINPDPNRALHDYFDDKIVVIPVGLPNPQDRFDEHIITVLLWKKIFVKVDLSNDEGDHFGIYFYHIAEGLDEEVLRQSIKDLYSIHKEEKSLFDSMDLLKLTRLAWLKQVQVRGNCSFMSAKYTLPPLSILLELQDLDQIDGQLVKNGWDQVKAAFNAWEEEELEQTATLLKEILADATKPPELSRDFQEKLCSHLDQLRDPTNRPQLEYT